MKDFFVCILILSNFLVSTAQANDAEIQCNKDLLFIEKTIKESSAPYKNDADLTFKDRFSESSDNAKKLLSHVTNTHDCYYALKYYVNSLREPSFSLVYENANRLPNAFPGILTALDEKSEHIVIYKNPNLEYLKDINLGDRLKLVDEEPTNVYFIEEIIPFYSNSQSQRSLYSASLNTLVADANPWISVPKKITLQKGDGSLIELNLKYTPLTQEAISVINLYRKPTEQKVAFTELSKGTIIRLPNFLPNLEEAVIFNNIFKRLNEFAKKDYIIFDLRGNMNGVTNWSMPILRNLFGDEYIKSLGTKHSYNHITTKKLRVTKSNFENIKDKLSPAIRAQYIKVLHNNQDFLLENVNNFGKNQHLYSHNKKDSVNAKIVLFTDRFCSNACWYFVRNMKQIPGVLHFGDATDMQSQYSQSIQTILPNKKMTLFYPVQITSSSAYQDNYQHVPDKIYEGDYEDESEITKWILDQIQ